MSRKIGWGAGVLMWWLMVSGTIQAQSGMAVRDSLKSALDTEQDVVKRIEICNDLINEQYGNPDAIREYFDQAIREIEKARSDASDPKELRQLQTLEGAAHSDFGLVNHSYSRFDSAEVHYNRALVLQDPETDQRARAATLNFLGRIYERKGNGQRFYDLTREAEQLQLQVHDSNGLAYSSIALADYFRREGSSVDTVEHYFRRAIEFLATSTDPNYKAFCLDAFAFYLSERGRFEEAIERFYDALELHKANGIIHGHCKSLMHIAMIHEKMGEGSRALQLLGEALELAETSGSPEMIEGVYENLAAVYSKLNEHQKSLEHYQEALTITREHHLGAIVEGMVLLGMGKEAVELEQPRAAINYLTRSQAVAGKSVDPLNRAATLLLLGQAYTTLAKPDSARFCWEKAFQLGEAHEFVVVLRSASKELYQLAESQGDYKTAFHYLQSYGVAKDSLKVAETQKLLIKKDAEYQIQNKEQERLLEKQRADLLVQERTISNYWFLGTSIVMVLLIAVGFLSALYFRAKRKEEQARLQQSSLEINQLQDQVERLLKDESYNPFRLVIETSINQYLNHPLSDRELEVLNQLSKGKSNNEIAEALYISVNTIRTHLQSIYGKLEVKNRTQAVKKVGEILAVNG